MRICKEYCLNYKTSNIEIGVAGFLVCLLEIVLGSGVLLQQSQDLLARNLLELTTSLPDAFSIQSGEIVSTATEPKRASPEFPRASNLSPRRKSPSSREIASFPGTLWGEGTLFIIQHNI